MADSTITDNMPTTLAQSFIRSKSYESKINSDYDTDQFENDNDQTYDSESNKNKITKIVDSSSDLNNNNLFRNELLLNNLTSNSKIENQQKNSIYQTQITVTSFAPEPKAKNYIHVKSANYYNGSQNKDDYLDNNQNRNLSLIWPNGKNSAPIIIFSSKVVRKTCWECKKIGGILIVFHFFSIHFF
jgi:hypothetical protein